MRNTLAVLIAIMFSSLMFSCAVKAAEIKPSDFTVGLHVGSVHIPAADHLNDVNPGIYVRHSSGATVGMYRNSLKRNSFYAGWTFEYGPAAITVGAISGYQNKKTYHDCSAKQTADGYTSCWTTYGNHDSLIGLLVAPSVRLPTVFSIKPRLTFLPRLSAKGHSVIHLSLERSF